MKKMKIVVAAAVLAGMLSGCAGSQSVAPAGSDAPAQSTALSISASSAASSAVSAVPGSTAESSTLTEYESDYGYRISYDAGRFDYRRTEGYDEFVLKSDATDKPFIFVCISRVGAEFADQVKLTALGEGATACTIGGAQMQAQYHDSEEAWDGGKIMHRTYTCMLDTGDMLLIETQWYTGQTEEPYDVMLTEIVNSIEATTL